ncbi:MAG: hypothetical protein AAF291_08700 [Pseudomonadota bacterium]
MIGSDRAALSDRADPAKSPSRARGPLAMLGLLLAVWVTGRAYLWESPFSDQPLIARAMEALAEAPSSIPSATPEEDALVLARAAVQTSGTGSFTDTRNGLRVVQDPAAPAFDPVGRQFAMAHNALWQAALTEGRSTRPWATRPTLFQNAIQDQTTLPVFPAGPRFAPKTKDAPPLRKPDRWSLGAWAFVREGSTSPGIAAGPAPIYGASQIGGNLQHSLAPQSGHDPRAYLRAARALIDRPETEVALGASAQPVRKLPLRVAAEMRVTDNAFGSDVRPAAFAITQIPPLALPLGMTAEIYGAAGYVGGKADTGFAEGQTTLTRELADFDLRRAEDLRISVGAGAWGGAQRGARRLDVGPTVRIDMALGEVPARLSLDYRERVGGNAAPISGMAATLSAQF